MKSLTSTCFSGMARVVVTPVFFLMSPLMAWSAIFESPDKAPPVSTTAKLQALYTQLPLSFEANQGMPTNP